ncbi:MAG: tRNA 2-thiouridine(34) synthase MnmA [Patescibacteria group bacterium]
MESKPKILLGMSGGVDSSVAAVLLLKQGYEVIGAFMKNWSDGDDLAECSWRTERRDAQRVAAKLGIDFHTFDFEDAYRQNVYEYMLHEYEAGRTPNPDVLCNKYMKFGYLMREAEKLGCDVVATGHYARIKHDQDGTAHLLSGLDNNKDQSYFLCQLSQDQLKKTMFPIGDLQKNEVRKIAHDHDLHVANKKDSQGICFVGKVEMIDFLRERIPEKEGNIITTSGEVIGQHRGHQYYTIGQRSGLGIGGGTPYFIVERRPGSNEVVVALGEDDERLYSTHLQAEQLSETVPDCMDNFVVQPIQARIRYRQPLQSCQIKQIKDGVVTVEFDQPQRAVAPGQFIAFYNQDELIGSAIIK